MELSARKKAILREIVRSHIEFGEPVGSKILATKLENAPSTATLRNEMSELCLLGYLEQPHASAGRLPTSKAYRLFVNELMSQTPITDDERITIDRMLENVRHDPETLGSAAAEILSQITGLPAISASGSDLAAKIKRVSLLPMGRTVSLVFVITEDGRTKSRLVHTSAPLDASPIALFEKIVEERICAKEISLLDKAYLQSTVVSAGLSALSLAPLLSTVFDLAEELKRAHVDMSGAANLFSVCRRDTEAKKILDLLKTGEAVYSIFSGITAPIEVVFGEDTEFSALASSGMIVASYGEEDRLGKLCLIGPTRMSYERLMPSVGYLAGRVGEIMTEILKGMEE